MHIVSLKQLIIITVFEPLITGLSLEFSVMPPKPNKSVRSNNVMNI
jgi:hypothetical protein